MTEVGQGRPSAAAAVRADLNALMLRVTPQDVLVIGNAVRAESILLIDKIYRARLETVVGEPGQDPVSLKAVPLFNNKIHQLLTECEAYAHELAAAADELAHTARLYGHTEQEIRDSFTRYQAQNPPPTSPTSTLPPRPS
jgi:hypothetical protein